MNALILAFAMSLGLQPPSAPPQPTVEVALSTFQQAKKLTLNGDYEGSLILLAAVKPTREEYNEYCFLMACNHFSLNNKQEAEKWLKNISDSFEKLTRRHEVLVAIMLEDIQNWKEGDLPDIERDMRISADKLKNAMGGQKTQAIQKQIIDKLDKLIKDQEDKANAAAAAANQPKDKDGNPIPLPPGAQPSQGQGQPAPDSVVMGGGGKGKVDDKKLRQLAENWGTLPPAKRAAVIQEITRDLPEKYRPMIEDYFKALNRIHPNK